MTNIFSTFALLIYQTSALNTRDKIIELAVKHFNRDGFGAVSLFQIANEMGISRGNLTYHFKDKEVLLQSIASEMWQKIDTERIKSRQFPSFENLRKEVQLLYKFQKRYAFIFLDTHVLNHPLIRKEFRQLAKRTIADNKATIAFSIQSGNMKPEQIAGTYSNIAFTVWMLAFYWFSQQIILGQKSGQDAEKMIWSILLPFFTKKGLQAFKQFFGEAYLKELGQSFEQDINQINSF